MITEERLAEIEALVDALDFSAHAEHVLVLAAALREAWTMIVENQKVAFRQNEKMLRMRKDLDDYERIYGGLQRG